MVRDPGAHPRVGREEAVHPVLVAGEDDDELVPLVLHDLEQDVDDLLAVIARVLGPVQVVRLVDEQHPAHGPVQHPLRLRRRLPDELRDQVVPHRVDQLPGLQVPEPVQQLGHAQRHGGLAGAGGPVKHMCRFGRGALSPKRCRARSTSSSAAISWIRFFTGCRPTRSLSSAANTSSMLAAARSAAKRTVASGGSEGTAPLTPAVPAAEAAHPGGSSPVIPSCFPLGSHPAGLPVHQWQATRTGAAARARPPPAGRETVGGRA